MNEFLTRLAIAMVPILAGALASLISVVTAYLVGLVKQKFGENAARESAKYLSIMDEVSRNAVVALQQSVVDNLKKNGRWDAIAAERVKADAVRLAIDSLGPGRRRIEAHLKVDLPRYMEGLVERALADLKAQQNLPTTQG